MFFCGKEFRSLIQNLDHVNSDVTVCFDPRETFQTQYAQIAVKPIALIVYNDAGEKQIALHEQLLQLCNGTQPFVCINPKYFIFNKEAKLQAITLKEPKKAGRSGFLYSPCRLFTSLDDEEIEKILEWRIKQENE